MYSWIPYTEIKNLLFFGNYIFVLFFFCGWETWTEYYCTPTKVFLSFSQSLRRPPTVAMWLKAKTI